MASVLNEKYFHDEAAAFVALENIMWANGKPPHCPHCGVMDRMNRLAVQKSKPSKKHPEGKPVHGLWKCYACRKQFTVRKGTVFEASHLELHQWFQAAYLLCSSKKGCSSNQLARTLGCTVKSAWFASHRIREAMRDMNLFPFGAGGSEVEVDETYIGRDKTVKPKGQKKGRGPAHKYKVLSLLDRKKGQARSMVMGELTVGVVLPILKHNIVEEARIMTDESSLYRRLGDHFDFHGSVEHGADEYVSQDDPTIHTNTIEGFFSIFKRGMKGVYQHCSEKHLHRYLAEFDFRYNNRTALGVNDLARATNALKGAKGKRLTYRRTGELA